MVQMIFSVTYDKLLLTNVFTITTRMSEKGRKSGAAPVKHHRPVFGLSWLLAQREVFNTRT